MQTIKETDFVAYAIFKQQSYYYCVKCWFAFDTEDQYLDVFAL